MIKISDTFWLNLDLAESVEFSKWGIKEKTCAKVYMPGSRLGEPTYTLIGRAALVLHRHLQESTTSSLTSQPT